WIHSMTGGPTAVVNGSIGPCGSYIYIIYIYYTHFSNRPSPKHHLYNLPVACQRNVLNSISSISDGVVNCHYSTTNINSIKLYVRTVCFLMVRIVI
ncbi:hypothetical protein L9F63_015687, partial [Diploptera punctata]